MTGRRQLVVGVDGSDESLDALRWGSELAVARDWHVVAVLAWDLLDQPRLEGAPFDPHYDERDAAAVLRQQVQRALGDAAEAVECRPLLGHAARVLLDTSADAELLVVGARGLGGFRGLLLGSVSQQCLHHAAVPVAVVRRATPVVARIVVGFDGSDHARAALRWAADHARATKAELHVVHAWHPAYVGAGPFGLATGGLEGARDAAGARLDGAMEWLRSLELARPPVASLVEGGAAAALIEKAADAELVVVGARGLGGFAGLVLGSVSDQVSRHAPCPVVVVPGATSAAAKGT
jgi:nucleotide-binding universal stress UspA family protein